MKQKTIGIAISVVTVLVMMELVSAGWYLLAHGKLFYTSDHSVAAPADQVEDPVDATAPGGVRHRIHPYFGFTKWTSPDERKNNDGFPGNQYDFPFRKTSPNQYVIAVFGGSVATSFSNLGQDRLVQRLKEHPALADKEIILLNIAQGGYKQPQGLLALGYYLASGQELDMVINLDGFNDVALSARNAGKNVDASMPSVDHLLPLADLVDQSMLTPERVAALQDMYRRQERLANLAQGVEQARLASAAFIQEQLYRIEANRYRQAAAQFQDAGSVAADGSLVFLAPSLAGPDEDGLYRRVADIWANSSAMMQALLADRNIPYYHFLQTNQYVSNKPLTAEEKRTAYTVKHPYAVAAVKGYPYLLARAADLRSQGVNFFSALEAFDEHPETLYIDDCCHFNLRGNEILADFLADAILSSPPFAAAADTDDLPQEPSTTGASP